MGALCDHRYEQECWWPSVGGVRGVCWRRPLTPPSAEGLASQWRAAVPCGASLRALVSELLGEFLNPPHHQGLPTKQLVCCESGDGEFGLSGTGSCTDTGRGSCAVTSGHIMLPEIAQV